VKQLQDIVNLLFLAIFGLVNVSVYNYARALRAFATCQAYAYKVENLLTRDVRKPMRMSAAAI
jgi:hypothetical protein